MSLTNPLILGKRLRGLSLALLIILSVIVIPLSVLNNIPQASAQTTLDTTNHVDALGRSTSEQRTIFARDLWWVFYSNATHMNYKTSSDGVTWSDIRDFRTGIGGFSMWNDISTNRIYYVHPSGINLLWRNGTLESDGSITWHIAETTALVNTGFPFTGYVSIMQNVIGPRNLFVLASVHRNSPSADGYTIFRFDVSLGTWSAVDSTFGGGAAIRNVGAVVETTAGHMALIMRDSGADTVLLSYSADQYDSVSKVNIAGDATKKFRGDVFSIIGRANKLHLAGMNGESKISYFSMTFGDVDFTPTVLDSDVQAGYYPTLTKISSSTLGVYYLDGTIVNAIISVDNGATWGDIQELTAAEVSAIMIQGVYSVIDFIAGIAWRGEAGSPFNVRFMTHDLEGSIVTASLNFSDTLRVCDTIYLFRGDAINLPLNVTYPLGADRIQAVALQFTDGISNITLTHNVTRNKWIGQSGTLFNGDDAVSFGLGTKQYDPSNGWVIVNYPIVIQDGMIDQIDIDFQFRVYDNETGWFSWSVATIAESLDVSTYILGGLKSWAANGNAGLVNQGDTFEIFSDESGSVQVNQTWRKLQAYHFQNSWKVAETAGFTSNYDEYFQDPAHNDGGNEKDSGPGDWTVYYTFYYCDVNNDQWVRGWEAQIETAEGDVGTNDAWIALNIAWYRRGVLMSTDKIYTFPEPDEKAEIRLWTDLWFNRENASRVHGGRVYPYYYGMDKDGPLIFWATWAPTFQNATTSFYVNATLGADDRIMTVRDLDFMKIGINITRGLDTGTGNFNNPFRFSLVNYEISEITQAQGRMVGIPTPIKVSTQVPDLGVAGFLQPLWAIFSRLGGIIMDALRAGAGALWSFVAQQAPWFTSFWELAYELIVTLFGWIPNLTDLIFTVGDLASPYTGFIGTIIKIITEGSDFVSDALAPFAGNFDALLFLIFLGMFVFPLMQRINDGDWNGVKEEINMFYQAINAVLLWLYRMVKFVIDFIVGLIPL